MGRACDNRSGTADNFCENSSPLATLLRDGPVMTSTRDPMTHRLSFFHSDPLVLPSVLPFPAYSSAKSRSAPAVRDMIQAVFSSIPWVDSISLIRSGDSGQNLNFRHLDRIVGSRGAMPSARRIKKVFSGGSSNTLSRLFWAWTFIRWASRIQTILEAASLGLADICRPISRTWAMDMFFLLSSGPRKIISGCMPALIFLQDGHELQGTEPPAVQLQALINSIAASFLPVPRAP